MEVPALENGEHISQHINRITFSEVSDRMNFLGTVPTHEQVLQVPEELGTGLKLLSEKKGNFSLEKATWLLHLEEFKVSGALVDRNLKDSHVTKLLTAAQGGRFHPEWVQIISCVCLEQIDQLPPGTEYRMNGQHTAWMRIYMPKEWPCEVRFLKYEAQSVADMRMLYATIDRNSPRTPGNVTTAMLAGIPMFEGISTTNIRLLTQGLSVWLWADKEERRKHDADELACLIQTEHSDVGTKVCNYLSQCPKGRIFEKTIRRAPVVAAMFETFSKHPNKCPEFWDAVRDGLGEGVTGLKDPRIKLHNALREATIGQCGDIGDRRKGGERVGRIVPQEGMYRWCISCWNNWRKGVEIANLVSDLTGDRPKAK